MADTATTRVCIACHEPKPLKKFRASGTYLRKCSSCRYAAQRESQRSTRLAAGRVRVTCLRCDVRFASRISDDGRTPVNRLCESHRETVGGEWMGVTL